MASVDPMKFTGVILYSQGNICFPRDFRFQYSFNGSEFVDIPGASYTDYQLTDETKHVFAFDTPQVATHIRAAGHKKAANSQGNYLVQIAEVEPRGFEPTQDEIASAENAFNVATDNLPVNPDVKPTPIPVGRMILRLHRAAIRQPSAGADGCALAGGSCLQNRQGRTIR